MTKTSEIVPLSVVILGERGYDSGENHIMVRVNYVHSVSSLYEMKMFQYVRPAADMGNR